MPGCAICAAAGERPIKPDGFALEESDGDDEVERDEDEFGLGDTFGDLRYDGAGDA